MRELMAELERVCVVDDLWALDKDQAHPPAISHPEHGKALDAIVRPDSIYVADACA
jgi:hypothetical protein